MLFAIHYDGDEEFVEAESYSGAVGLFLHVRQLGGEDCSEEDIEMVRIASRYSVLRKGES